MTQRETAAKHIDKGDHCFYDPRGRGGGLGETCLSFGTGGGGGSGGAVSSCSSKKWHKSFHVAVYDEGYPAHPHRIGQSRQQACVPGGSYQSRKQQAREWLVGPAAPFLLYRAVNTRFVRERVSFEVRLGPRTFLKGQRPFHIWRQLCHAISGNRCWLWASLRYNLRLLWNLSTRSTNELPAGN